MMSKNEAFQQMLKNQNLIDSVMNPLTGSQKEEFLGNLASSLGLYWF